MSLTGWQVAVHTDNSYMMARIDTIDDFRIREELKRGRVVVVAGFQGVDPEGYITTLGRGGSDTSAVAIAAALHADECLIFTDVDGVYTTDPRIVPEAKRLNNISFEEMLELASAGSKVLQIRSVEFAGKFKVPCRVLSSLTDPDLPVEVAADVAAGPCLARIGGEPLGDRSGLGGGGAVFERLMQKFFRRSVHKNKVCRMKISRTIWPKRLFRSLTPSW